MIRSVTIGATINIGNYESLRIEVIADTADEARRELVQIARETGTGITRDMVEKYLNRIEGIQQAGIMEVL